VHVVPEDVCVAVGAERGVGHAARLRVQPAGAAAGAVPVHEPDGGNIGAGGEGVGVGQGVAKPRRQQLTSIVFASVDLRASLKPAASWFKPSAQAPVGLSTRTRGTHPTGPTLMMPNFLAPSLYRSCMHGEVVKLRRMWLKIEGTRSTQDRDRVVQVASYRYRDGVQVVGDEAADEHRDFALRRRSVLPRLRRGEGEYVVASNAQEEEGLGEQAVVVLGVRRASPQLVGLHLGFGGLEVKHLLRQRNVASCILQCSAPPPVRFVLYLILLYYYQC
jgi:hypothetical protein